MEDFLTPLGIIVAASYYTVSWYKWGATWGQFLSGLRVVSIEGKPLSFQRSLLRYIGCLFSALVLGLGFLWILIDKRGQGWHDKIASTAVLPIEVFQVSGKM
ncbi:RDD family protein [bacterium]|nr:RDD family protein [bacterium]